nr:aldehyde dehydrogenase family protein [Klebsiella variicola]
MEALIADAVALGAKVLTGGKRLNRPGFFFEPTVLADVPKEARIMHEDPLARLPCCIGSTPLRMD